MPPRTPPRQAPVYRGRSAISTGCGLKIRSNWVSAKPLATCRGPCRKVSRRCRIPHARLRRVVGRTVSWEDGYICRCPFSFGIRKIACHACMRIQNRDTRFLVM